MRVNQRSLREISIQIRQQQDSISQAESTSESNLFYRRSAC